jgi:hypothetical protein
MSRNYDIIVMTDGSLEDFLALLMIDRKFSDCSILVMNVNGHSQRQLSMVPKIRKVMERSKPDITCGQCSDWPPHMYWPTNEDDRVGHRKPEKPPSIVICLSYSRILERWYSNNYFKRTSIYMRGKGKILKSYYNPSTINILIGKFLRVYILPSESYYIGPDLPWFSKLHEIIRAYALLHSMDNQICVSSAFMVFNIGRVMEWLQAYARSKRDGNNNNVINISYGYRPNIPFNVLAYQPSYEGHPNAFLQHSKEFCQQLIGDDEEMVYSVQ